MDVFPKKPLKINTPGSLHPLYNLPYMDVVYEKGNMEIAWSDDGGPSDYSIANIYFYGMEGLSFELWNDVLKKFVAQYVGSGELEIAAYCSGTIPFLRVYYSDAEDRDDMVEFYRNIANKYYSLFEDVLDE